MSQQDSTDLPGRKNDSQPMHEFEGVTVEEAINQALSVMKVSRERIEVKVLREGKRGLFGMEGAEKAKIQITIREENIRNE